MVEWREDTDGDWLLHVNGQYSGILFNGATRFYSSASQINSYLNTTDLEEAKNIAFALWALNQ